MTDPTTPKHWTDTVPEHLHYPEQYYIVSHMPDGRWRVILNDREWKWENGPVGQFDSYGEAIDFIWCLLGLGNQLGEMQDIGGEA